MTTAAHASAASTQQTTAETQASRAAPERLALQQEETECLFPLLAAFISSSSLIRCLSRVPISASVCSCVCVCVSYTSENASAGSVVYVHLSTSLMDDVESVARWQTGVGLQLNCTHKHKIWDFHRSHRSADSTTALYALKYWCDL